MSARFVISSTSDISYSQQRSGGGSAVLSGTNEEANFRDLEAVLIQLGNVASHAAAIFQDLYNDAAATRSRVDALGQRIEKNLSSAAVGYIESKIVSADEPMYFYKSRVEATLPKYSTDTGNIFSPESLPAGLAERCRSKLDIAVDFSAVDALSVRQTQAGDYVEIGKPEFRPAALSISNPNWFTEQFMLGLREDAIRQKEEQRANREKKKERRARKKSSQADSKARVRRVRKKKRAGVNYMIGVDDDDDAESAFKKIDVDGSGFLERSEVQAAFVHLGEEMNEEQMQAAMAAMDSDNDGQVRRLRFPLSRNTIVMGKA